ncbi:cupin domain-containing protein [Roseivirga sp. BDSF3-8]|uniref:cupin domain-containing protein n=1 Tax=Roseivirga sp. BDSF3-8 TaxID=3241598 RepID=UPI003531A833
MRKSEGPFWIEQLSLKKHPEGGWYKEMYRAEGKISDEKALSHYGSARHYYTSIYFLLNESEISAFHRLRSDELWYYHAGSSLTLYVIDQKGSLSTHILGPGVTRGEHMQLLIPANSWFAAEVNNPLSYTLMGCAVAPGFEFEDFELADGSRLAEAYPEHEALIRRLSVN